MSQRAESPPLGNCRAGTVYLVLDCQADRQTLVADLLSGQYRHPLRVVAFNTEDSSTHDVTTEFAHEVLRCAAGLEHELPTVVRDFVQRAGC